MLRGLTTGNSQGAADKDGIPHVMSSAQDAVPSHVGRWALEKRTHRGVLRVSACKALALGDEDANRDGGPVDAAEHHQLGALHVEAEKVNVA